jgi:predicted dehydrogenase
MDGNHMDRTDGHDASRDGQVAADMTAVRWGVLGTARIARRKVLPAMAQSTSSRAVAVASRDAARAQAVADEFGIERAHGSYEALLEDSDVDVVYNALPNHLHVPWSVRAADAGKHVLCEKPIALSAAEALELRAARDANGVLVGEAFMVRLHPQWQAARRLVQDRRIGELRAVGCHFSYALRDDGDIRNRADWGGGGLMDIGCYAVHIARWMFDTEPRRVVALMERDPSNGTDRLTSGMLDFDGGQASFTCGTQLVPYQRVQLLGTLGRIEVEIPFNAPPDHACRVLLDDGGDVHGSSIEAVRLEAADQYALQADAFSSAVRGRGAVPVPLEDGIANMRVLDALFRSAETGAWVEPAGG